MITDAEAYARIWQGLIAAAPVVLIGVVFLVAAFSVRGR